MKESGSLVDLRVFCHFGKGMEPKKSSPAKRRRTTERLTLLDKRVEAEMFQSIAELGNDGILVFDEHYGIEFANRMASEITGYSNEELLKMTVLSLLGKTNQALLEDLFVHPERYGEKVCTELHIQVPGSTGKTTTEKYADVVRRFQDLRQSIQIQIS